MLDEMTQQNVSKFAIFLEYENTQFFFVFHFPNECPGLHTYVDIDQGIPIHYGKNKVA